MWHALRLPVGFYFARSPGDLAFRVRLNDNVAAVLSGRLSTVLLDLVLVVFYGAFMFYLDRWLTLIGVADAGCAPRAAARRDSHARRPQPPHRPARGQARGRRFERAADDRDHQGHRFGERVFRSMGRLPGQARGGAAERGAARAAGADGQRDAFARQFPARARGRRAARDGRTHHRGRARRFPELDGELRRSRSNGWPRRAPRSSS